MSSHHSSPPPPPPPPPPQHSVPYATAPAPTIFTAEANRYLSNLAVEHTLHLQRGDDIRVLATSNAAAAIRRAAVVYVAATDILPAVSSRHNLTDQADYLAGLIARLWAALTARDVSALARLSDAAQAVLDGFQAGERGVFQHLEVVPFSVDGNTVGQSIGRRKLEVVAGDDQPASNGATSITGDIFGAEDARRGKKKNRGCCGLIWTQLSARDRVVLALYLVMVLFSLGAIAAVTVNFVQQQVQPGSFIRSEVSNSLEAPVVTVCLSQRGVPFSRLQLFNFSDAQGRVYRGADPKGPQTKRQGPDFARVVERFWDNPDNEDCDRVVGDFYPFPLQSLNDLTAGRTNTKCRPCYRVGKKETAIVTSTDFNNSSVLSFYTDNYFLQCMKTTIGLDEDSLKFMHAQIKQVQADMKDLGVLEYEKDQLEDGDIEKLNPEQICNLMYFGYFPRRIHRDTGDIELDDVDVSYSYNEGKWEPSGQGPYFQLPKQAQVLPEESLQMFVSTKGSSDEGQLGKNRDMILIGPNTQTFATIRPVIVYEEDRYDISSSTSNLMQGSIVPIFGYWLVYRVFYNYNRFVTDEWYRESTYPASQWIVDLTGYASLFTGASLFSLLLLPLLRAMRRREKQKLIKQKPEVYLWSHHKQRYNTDGAALPPSAAEAAEARSADLMRGTSVVLPGYNI